MENTLLEKNPKIVLASASPRRKEIMQKMGLSFEIITSDADESLPDGTPPIEIAKMLSRRKAEAVSRLCGANTIVIGSDTLLEFEGAPLGKPESEAHAVAMLNSLSGKKHYVHTAITVIYEKKVLTDADSTAVFMKPFSEKEVKDYVATGECMDKAGSYAIQGLGGALVDRIEGEYDTVVGLTSSLLSKMIAEILK